MPQTLGLPSVREYPNVVSGSGGIRTHVRIVTMRTVSIPLLRPPVGRAHMPCRALISAAESREYVG